VTFVEDTRPFEPYESKIKRENDVICPEHIISENKPWLGLINGVFYVFHNGLQHVLEPQGGYTANTMKIIIAYVEIAGWMFTVDLVPGSDVVLCEAIDDMVNPSLLIYPGDILRDHPNTSTTMSSSIEQLQRPKSLINLEEVLIGTPTAKDVQQTDNMNKLNRYKRELSYQ
jgi:hypothetical protein